MIVMYRGQKTFLVPIIECRNLIAYVQQKMDRLLHKFRQFVRTYIDDVIVRLRFFDKYIYHLHTIFQLFMDYNISIKLSKNFSGYKSINFLGQPVNAVGLAFSKSKFKAIAKIQFFSTLSKLETYLGMTGYLQKFLPFHTNITKPLQNLKILLLRGTPTQGSSRQNFSTKTKIIPSK